MSAQASPTLRAMVGMDAAVLLATLAAATPPPLPPPERPRPSAAPARTVGTAIRRAHLAGDLSWQQRRTFGAQLAQARRAARRLPPARAREVRGSLRVATSIAADGRLGAERLRPVMAAVTATTEVFRLRPFPAPAQRMQANGDGLVYEYRPGSGVHPHPLASAGRLNALAGACLHDRRDARCRPATMGRAADSLLELGVRDGRRLRMEYTFPFGSGRPPWTSAMAQATAAQAVARAARVTEERRYTVAADRLFRGLVAGGPAVRSGGRVARFAMYSFQPSMRVLNGELQTLVGLADYARLSRRREARRVLRRTSRGLLRELEAFDTGAWTLYAASGREASLHYHRLAESFAARACRRGLGRGFCPAAERYARYTREPPRLTVRAERVVRAGRRVKVTLRASKGAGGRMVVRGPRGALLRRAVDLGRRPTSLRFTADRAGRWRVEVAAVAVNGKRGTARHVVVVRPKPKPRRALLLKARRRREARERAERARRRARAEQRERRERAEPPKGDEAAPRKQTDARPDDAATAPPSGTVPASG